MQFIDLKTQQQAIKPELDRRIAEVLAHGQYIMGPEVAELEQTLANFVGVKHCVTVASGTEALLISLMALGVGPGDEVITSPFTFAASAEVIALLGARPVFVDVEPHTGNIDARLIAERIGDRTRAIMPISLYGQLADMEAICAVAADHGHIPVIEDGAQSFGAQRNGKRSCGMSTIGCSSFFPSKPLGCYGDGGALFTDDDTLAQAAREIRVHGQSKRYVHTRIGLGGRMDTLQCAIVLAKWPRFAWEVEQRHALGAEYTRQLAEVAHAVPVSSDEVGLPLSGLRTLALAPGNRSVYAQYTALVPHRDVVQGELKSAGIPTAVHYPIPLNEQPAYRSFDADARTPVASWLAEHVISLPMGPDLSWDDQRQVVGLLSEVLAGVSV
ncbi:DegT/DnrJ/EryC1/StrS family aminotransferase [Dyella sp. GSA-30]|uniref:DegT/DnrJ/EryC1/StrS family aminotransferase n=1 Tax=Dyella sp. GSA-30 TaxID=2994496 RepID=UPI0024922F68|nr:DegT/DnrJ/EryC1/StrS family aminotransferase [Dyella sp. GSA-30]BDU21499.1 aminotransferase DegT [Dyella sp. GSA-30]